MCSLPSFVLSLAVLALCGYWITSFLHLQAQNCILHRDSDVQVPYPMTICERWSKEWQRTILPLGSFASVTLFCPTLVPLKFWWLFPCGLKVLVQNSVLHHLFLPKTLSLGKAIYSCYSCHLHPASLKNWTKIIFLWGLSLPGGPQTQYMRSKLIHFLSEPVFPSLSLWFQQFRLCVRVNFSWC